MNLYLWPLVIFLTAVTVLLGVGWWITRDDQKVPLERLADPEPMPRDLRYGPFPADTAPLLLLSESMAAVEAHAREVDAMCKRAEQLGMMP